MKHALWIFTLCASVVVTPACSFGGPPASVESIQIYTQLIGLDEMFESMPDQFDETIQQYPGTDEEAHLKKRVARIGQKVWNTAVVKRRTIQYIHAHTTQDQINHLIARYRTPLGQKFVEAGLQTYRPRFEQTVIRYLQKFEANPPEPDRIEAIVRLVDASRLPDMMLDATVEMIRVMGGPLEELSSPGSSSKKQEWDKKVEAFRTQFRPMMEEQVLGLALVLYRDFSIGELNLTSEFLESDLGSFELEMNKGAILHAMTWWGKEMAKEAEKIAEREKV